MKIGTRAETEKERGRLSRRAQVQSYIRSSDPMPGQQCLTLQMRNGTSVLLPLLLEVESMKLAKGKSTMSGAEQLAV